MAITDINYELQEGGRRRAEGGMKKVGSRKFFERQRYNFR